MWLAVDKPGLSLVVALWQALSRERGLALERVLGQEQEQLVDKLEDIGRGMDDNIPGVAQGHRVVAGKENAVHCSLVEQRPVLGSYPLSISQIPVFPFHFGEFRRCDSCIRASCGPFCHTNDIRSGEERR